MITHSKQILAGLLSILIIAPSTSLNASWDWKDVAAAGAIAAGVGACVYVATRPEDPSAVRREAETFYQDVCRTNKKLLNTYRLDRKISEEVVYLITKKGTSYYTNKWFIQARDYLSDDCREHAPLLRGYAALRDESSKLLDYRRRLIDCCGSVYAARHEYYNFDNLQKLAFALEEIAQALEHKKIFMVTRDNFAIYRSQMEEIARTQERLALERARRRTHVSYHYLYDEDDFCYEAPKNHCQITMSVYN